MLRTSGLPDPWAPPRLCDSPSGRTRRPKNTAGHRERRIAPHPQTTESPGGGRRPGPPRMPAGACSAAVGLQQPQPDFAEGGEGGDGMPEPVEGHLAGEAPTSCGIHGSPSPYGTTSWKFPQRITPWNSRTTPRDPLMYCSKPFHGWTASSALSVVRNHWTRSPGQAGNWDAGGLDRLDRLGELGVDPLLPSARPGSPVRVRDDFSYGREVSVPPRHHCSPCRSGSRLRQRRRGDRRVARASVDRRAKRAPLPARTDRRRQCRSAPCPRPGRG